MRPDNAPAKVSRSPLRPGQAKGAYKADTTQLRDRTGMQAYGLENVPGAIAPKHRQKNPAQPGAGERGYSLEARRGTRAMPTP